ncbi:uncharacterized protein [Procambarus clarkii]|uniref:uncharacterized protein n=1 Tax=Procambarus clarkii TaxID=6728 RepID=UPI00374474C8
MLKWLVTRGPTPTPPVKEVVTDDPLATLRVKANAHHIYAVSRVNPLYHEEETESTEGLEEEEEGGEEEEDGREEEGRQKVQLRQQKEEDLLESPPIDRSSVRSSGYGSKETDSASERSDGHDDDDLLGSDNALSSATSRPPSHPDGHHTAPGGTGVGETGDGKVTESIVEFGSCRTPASPGEGRGAVISAGGKAVAAIVTQHPHFVHAIQVGMRRTRSLEMVRRQPAIQQSGSSTVPRPVWPSTGQLPHNQGTSRKALQQIQELFTFPESGRQRVPSPVEIVTQDLRYVTAIDVTPLRPVTRAKTLSLGRPRQVPGSAKISGHHHDNMHARKVEVQAGSAEDRSITRYFGEDRSHPAFSLMSLQPDSLVTEDTLRMMRYGREDDLLEDDHHYDDHHHHFDDDHHHYESPIQLTHSATMPDFSQAVYTRGLYATLNRAASLSTKDMVKPPYKVRSKSFDISIPIHKSCPKKRGLLTIKDLWERSGLKTNGRKLIVSDDMLDIRKEPHEDVSRRYSVGSSVEHLRTFDSSVPNNERLLQRLESDTTNRTSTTTTYDDLHSFESSRCSHPSLETKSSGSYAEINDIVPGGVDNPAFLDDSGHPRFPSPPPIIHHNGKPLMPANKFLDPDKLAAFQKKISEKLQGAPLHRMQWLDLDDIVLEDATDSRQERRVKFTADTINPGSLERGGMEGFQRGGRRSPPVPGGALRSHNNESLEGRRLQEATSKTTSKAASDADHKGIWAISESYRDRFQEAPAGTMGRGRRQQLWETYYGTTGGTLPRPLAPHPNSKAPICGGAATCLDFTLDLRRSDKLRQRSEARRRRRRCYVLVLVVVALGVFLGVVVAVSLYYTSGQKFFGPM